MRSGRFFIAGDAAHIHSPFGGQGMNTGLQDVWNLAWKLDMVIRNHAGEALLDSYTAERRPVIKHVIEITDFLTKALGTPSKLAQLLRDTVIRVVSRLAPFQHAFVQRLSELGISYHGSPIIEGAGERYLDDSLRGGQLLKDRFVLMVGEQREPAMKEEARRLRDRYTSVVEMRTHPGQHIKLIRPDGYVAFSSHDHNTKRIVAHLNSLLQQQTGFQAAA